MKCHCGGKIVRMADGTLRCFLCQTGLCTGRDPHVPAKEKTDSACPSVNCIVQSSRHKGKG